MFTLPMLGALSLDSLVQRLVISNLNSCFFNLVLLRYFLEFNLFYIIKLYCALLFIYHWLVLLIGPVFFLCNTYYCIVDPCKHSHDNKSIWILSESSECDYESGGNFPHNCSCMFRTTEKCNLVFEVLMSPAPSQQKETSILFTSALVDFRHCICVFNDMTHLTVLGFTSGSHTDLL